MEPEVINVLQKNLKALARLCGSWGKKSLKESIANAEKQIKTNPNNPDLNALLNPFIEAIEVDQIKYQSILAETFSACFIKGLQANTYIPFRIQEKLLTSIFKVRKFQGDEGMIKAAKIVMQIFNSEMGKLFIHGNILSQAFLYLTSLHSISEQRSTKKEIEKMIKAEVNFVVQNYLHPFVIPSTLNTNDSISKYITETITRNSLYIQEFLPNIKTATISDVDIAIILKSFTRILTTDRYSLSTKLLASELYISFLKSDSRFLESESFITILRTDIHLALLSLCLDPKMELAKVTGELISVVWERFATFYNEGLNEVLDKGLNSALSSPYSNVVLRSFEVFNILASNPQFLVDSYVNYDCDQSGFFKNIFENTANQIVQKAYPEQRTIELQKNGLKTLNGMLNYMWTYFNETMEQEEANKETEEAQIALESKKIKNELEQAQYVFKKSPMKGLKYFSDHQMCEDNAESYANFLFNTPSLDPSSVGEVIGGCKDINISILKSFVSKFDFKNMSFEQAFRTFLSKFQIPGESQMIDRIMEQFGTKFYNDNPKLFSCADTVYVLAFSTLMLHTDAHHPNVTKHMTLPEFIRNNRGIDNGKDLPESFLEELYKGITTHKINISNNSIPSYSLLNYEQRANLYQVQCKETLENARKRTSTELESHQFHRAKSHMLIGPMFQSIWGGVLASLTMSFEMSDDPEIIDYCLKGLQLCTHIASHAYVSEALETLVDSFAKFTRLQIHTSQLKEKNFLCTKALFHCANNDYLYLKGVWGIVMNQISALDKMNSNKNVIINLSFTDELFQIKSRLLNRELILDFVKAMCNVALSEIYEKPLRGTMLYYITVVAIANMNREMYIWKDIWSILGEFFVRIGSSNNQIIVMTSLKVMSNLALAFLEKEETSQMHYQQAFMQPFYDIFERQLESSSSLLVLDIISNIIKKLAPKLHSAWGLIFQILAGSATQSGELFRKGIELETMIVMDYLDYVVPFASHLFTLIQAF
ncbi:Sec7 domain containing protein [Histomonas meleagridis]|uniref:Sec7 domain containing protein n=1 Tax=Histomonas meleagridis TaxID=135588 RepID=UPI00355A7B6A|nr:Sec7 domain containing protein [Histomonas meleagridis]KAH0805297.1 Sec7 domain containing protein [Histomonas meleagridis]